MEKKVNDILKLLSSLTENRRVLSAVALFCGLAWYFSSFLGIPPKTLVVIVLPGGLAACILAVHLSCSLYFIAEKSLRKKRAIKNISKLNVLELTMLSKCVQMEQTTFIVMNPGCQDWLIAANSLTNRGFCKKADDHWYLSLKMIKTLSKNSDIMNCPINMCIACKNKLTCQQIKWISQSTSKLVFCGDCKNHKEASLGVEEYDPRNDRAIFGRGTYPGVQSW